MKEIYTYKNIHSGERCFILGSGPSITNQDLSRLKNEITFCSNWFINHNNYDQLNINYYCVYDNNFVRPKPNPDWLSKVEKIKSETFFPSSWKGLIPESISPCYINYNNDIKIYNTEKFSTDPIKAGFYDGASVIINVCIPLAIFMGIKKIYLMGCESGYKIKNGDLSNAYFYNLKDHHTVISHDENSEKHWQDNLFASYEIVRSYCIDNGIQIINCTQGGELEIFEREDYLKVINEKENA